MVQYFPREVKTGTVERSLWKRSFSLCLQVPPLQGKLQYMRVLNDLPPFGGILFQTVGLVMHIFVYIKFVVAIKVKYVLFCLFARVV